MAWNVRRLRNILKDKLPETAEREYKSKAALRPSMTPKEEEELSKDVSAMANYPGGVLILGIDEEKDDVSKERLPARLNGYPIGEITQAWIEDKLEHLVEPRLPSYSVHRVNVGKDGDVYVIEIPRSSSAPHLAKDFRFYRRKGARSVPANYLEIEGIRHAGAPTELGIELYRGDTMGEPINRINLNIVIRNQGSRPSTGLYVSVLAPILDGISYDARSAPLDPRPLIIGDSEYRKFHMQFGSHHVQETLYPGQATQQMPIIRIRNSPGHSLIDSKFPDEPMIFQVQTLDNYLKTERHNIKELIDTLIRTGSNRGAK